MSVRGKLPVDKKNFAVSKWTAGSFPKISPFDPSKKKNNAKTNIENVIKKTVSNFFSLLAKPNKTVESPMLYCPTYLEYGYVIVNKYEAKLWIF